MRILPLTLLLTLCACEDPAPELQARAQQAARRNVAKRVQAQARAEQAGPVQASSWPAQAEPLQTELARNETVQACQQRLSAAMPMSVVESMAHVGYDSAVHDACVTIEAMRERKHEACDSLTVERAKSQCHARVAMVAMAPEDCPADEQALGRDGLCLAWAMRDPAFCAAASVQDEARCRAVLNNDANACDEATTQRDQCRAEVARYGSLLHEEARERVPQSRKAKRAHVSADFHHVDGGVFNVDLSRGVVVYACTNSDRVVVREANRIALNSLAVLRQQSTAAFVFDAPRATANARGRSSGASSSWAKLVTPTGQTQETNAETEERVTIEEFAQARGALISIDATFEWPRPNGGKDTLHATIHSFVRDVIDDPGVCAAPIERAGQ